MCFGIAFDLSTIKPPICRINEPSDPARERSESKTCSLLRAKANVRRTAGAAKQFFGCFLVKVMNRVITAIQAQKKNHDRVSIFLDGEYGFGLSRIVAAWLHIGQALDEKKIESLLAADANEVAFTKALRLLDRKPRTAKEINSRLLEGGFTVEQAETVLRRLQDSGLIADEKYARQWVENRNQMHPRSRKLIGFELKQKGIANEVIEQVLEDSSPDEELAMQAAIQYARKIRSEDRLEFRKRLSAFLARRGFSYGTIAPVVQKVWESRES